jgi:hypothetical protein
VPREEIETLVRIGELAIEHDTRVQIRGKETERYSYKLPGSIRWNARLIDDKLAAIRVCDPAIGSGAFPVGLMTEIVRARNTLTTYLPDKSGRNNYNFKRHAIQNCLYGVDIDPGAVEIAKLRLWLSLVVDEEDIKQIQPLPNLDYKIVCGNSLLGVEKNLFNVELFNELERLKPLYFNETSAKKKQEYQKQIDQLIKKITNDNETFDFEVYFSEVFHEKGGFDVVIANPPYGAEMSKAELKEIKKNLKITGNTNSAAVFIDYGINRITNNRGTLTHIVPKSLLFSEKWFGLVRAMLGKAPLLVDVEKAFENVLLEQVVFLFGKIVQTDYYLASKFLGNKFIRTIPIPNGLVLKYSAWICDVSGKEIEIAEKVTSKNIVYMHDISQTKRGVPLQKHLKKDGDYPVIRGKNIFRYGLRDVEEFLTNEDFNTETLKATFLSQPKIVSQNIVVLAGTQNRPGMGG